MSEDNQDQSQLPVEQKSVFELTVPATNTTDATISELKEKFKHLPEADSIDNVKVLKTARAEVRGVRVDAKKYCTELKQDIKKLNRQVDEAHEDVTQKLLEIEKPIDEKIKAYEKQKEEEKLKKKEEAEKKARELAEKIEAIKNAPLEMRKSSPKEIEDKIKQLESYELTEEIFGDTVGDAEVERELAVETLQEMYDDAVAVEKAAAEAKKAAAELNKREEEIAEQKRVDALKDKIKTMDEFIVKCATAQVSGEIEEFMNALETIVINPDEYGDLTGEATTKKASVRDTINQLLTAKRATEKATQDAEAEKERIEQEKLDLKEREEEFERKEREKDDEEAAKEEPEPVAEPPVEPEPEKVEVIDVNYQELVFSKNCLTDPYILAFIEEDADDEDDGDLQFYFFQEEKFATVMEQMKKGILIMGNPDNPEVEYKKIKQFRIYKEEIGGFV